jgi:4-amino-4-deoxy-L-arabinose transferase-like glycosyltransferase
MAAGEWASLAPFALALALGLFHLATLLRYPVPFVDEAYFANHAWGLIHTGRPFGPLNAGISEVFEGYWTYFTWGASAIFAAPILALGLSVFSARLAALAFGLILLAAVYHIGARLYDRRTGLVAMALVGLSHAFLVSSHLARPDIIVAAIGFGVIALTLIDRTTGFPWRGLLAGLTLALGFEIHPNAAIFGPVVVALFIVEHGWSWWRVPRLWGFVGGCAAGLALFVGIHILPYPRTFFALTNIYFGPTKNPPLLNPNLLLESFVNALHHLIGFGGYLLPVFVGALVWLAWRHTRADVSVLVIVGLVFAGYVAITPYKPPYYGIYLTPAADLATAVALAHLSRHWHEARRLLVTTALAWGLVGTTALSIVPLVRAQPMDAYDAAIVQLREVVPDGSVIMGNPRYWFGLADHPYFAWAQLAYYRAYAPDSAVEELIRWHRPDYFILDSTMYDTIVDDPSHLPPWEQRVTLPKEPFERFLAERGRLVATIDAQKPKMIWVYRLAWD